MKYLHKIIFFVVLFCLVIHPVSFALETDTHEIINEFIVTNTLNGFSLDDCLRNQLGFSEGYDEKFKFKKEMKVLEWIKIGGRYEDKPPWTIPYTRSVNHFHNPLTDEGFSGIWLTGFLSGESSIQWSQKPVETQSPGGHYSWHDVRGYFYNALTSTVKSERDENFAQTFRGLGQLMHLVQDLSVPAHTRDDFHALYNYEKWAKGEDENGNPNIDISSITPIFFDPSSISAPNPLAAVPVANLFDTNQYTGSNPDITLQGDVGLSEYTNANFFSRDTVFKDFPYPARDSVSLDDVAIADPRYPGTVLRKYYHKISDGDTGYRLASVSFLNGYEGDCTPSCSDWLFDIAELNDEVYGDYATLLIPRAIGYSSQILSYFFRGQIEAKLLPVFDDTKLQNIRIKVRNVTPTKETMGGPDSVFLLAYRYTPPGAPADGSGDIYSTVPYSYALSNELLYGKDDDGNDLEGDAYETEIYFNSFPVEIPIAEYPNVKFMLIYRGNLGEEKANTAMGESGSIIGKFGEAKPATLHEEWNTPPKGDYNWFQMESDIFGTNEYDGLAQNEIVGGKLTKTNIRYPIIPEPSDPWAGSHFNLSVIGVNAYSGDTYANDIFPIPVTRNTYLEFKIDEMTITPNTSPGGSFTHYQGMLLTFNNGYNLELSLGDQFWYVTDTGYFTFPVGTVIVDNIHGMFELCGMPVPDDFQLMDIRLVQQIGFNLPRDTQYEQRMVVDFIRIVEMEDMTPEE